ncbi:MAG: hypothetical protein ACHWZW_02820 [Spirulina sp.]
MPFFGTVPGKCVEQVIGVVPFKEWPAIYVCCSGTFRIEQALTQALGSGAPIYSNDVSLYSSVLGAWLTDRPFALTFQDELAFVQERFNEDFCAGVASVLVAHEMSRFVRNNDYSRQMFGYYVEHFEMFHEKAITKLGHLKETVSIRDYRARDWREHVDEAIAQGAGIAAFPPFIMGDYEKQYAFLDRCVTWPAPAYALYDPSQLDSILDKIESSGVPYCVLSDQTWPEKRQPMLHYVQGRKKPHFCYANSNRSSVRHLTSVNQPFKYEPVDVWALRPTSVVEVAQAPGDALNYFKDIYLAKNIIHTGGLRGYFVLIDGKYAGGIIYADCQRSTGKVNSRQALYVLSDLSVTGDRRLSKLIAMLATSRDVVRPLAVRLMKRVDWVVTTARSKGPVSMKYRDIYELVTRSYSEEEERYILNYAAPVVAKSPQQIYKQWFKKYASKATRPNDAHP